LLAAGELAELGVECRVLSIHTIKPLDVQAVIDAGRDCGAIVTVEEHSVHGGLGEACAGVLMQAGVSLPLRIVGIPDEDTVTGAQADIFCHYGLNMEGLTRVGLELLKSSQVSAAAHSWHSPTVAL
jgi:transketolase